MVESHWLLLFRSEVPKTISNYSMLIRLMLIKSWMLHPILCDAEASDLLSFFLFYCINTESRRHGMDGTFRFLFYYWLWYDISVQTDFVLWIAAFGLWAMGSILALTALSTPTSMEKIQRLCHTQSWFLTFFHFFLRENLINMEAVK